MPSSRKSPPRFSRRTTRATASFTPVAAAQAPDLLRLRLLELNIPDAIQRGRARSASIATPVPGTPAAATVEEATCRCNPSPARPASWTRRRSRPDDRDPSGGRRCQERRACALNADATRPQNHTRHTRAHPRRDVARDGDPPSGYRTQHLTCHDHVQRNPMLTPELPIALRSPADVVRLTMPSLMQV